MKAYTDLEQSKKLAEFLSIESADMYYIETSCNNYTIGILQRMERDMLLNKAEYYKMLPCWSLAALLKLMPLINEYNIEYRPIIERYADDGWACKYYNEETRSTDDVYVRRYGRTPLDAAFEMICWLKENGKI